MSKLDYDLLEESESFINPIKERELDLRGLKIQRIENLILTKDSNDAIDFTDNDIRLLGNFPKMSLKTMLLGNNRISKIENDLGKYLPELRSLVLNNNAITALGDLDPLGSCPKLEILSCIDNVVANHQYYRYYMIHRCPSIRILDGRKVRNQDRKKASILFSGEEGIKLLEELSKKSIVNEETITKKRSTPYQQPSEQERKRIKMAIKNAKTLVEIAQLEQQLAGGVVEL